MCTLIDRSARDLPEESMESKSIFFCNGVEGGGRRLQHPAQPTHSAELFSEALLSEGGK